jgi:tetraacyldisaccharide 4'-kinase
MNQGFPKIIKLLQWVLVPVSMLYGLIMDIRNVLYDKGFFRSESFPVPVISIGNISVGGSGKTPLTIHLANKLLARYGTLAVISRGYGRKTKGFRLVSDGRAILLNPDEAGDEPALIANRIPGAIVAVAEKRSVGIRRVLREFNPKLILLDDAFQHRSVERDLDIALINQQENRRGQFPLPAGRLREFRHNLRRAQIVLATNVETENLARKLSGVHFNMASRLSSLVDREGRIIGDISGLREKKTAAFAGIAYPELFFNGLRSCGVAPVFEKGYPDHYVFTVQDCLRLSELAGDGAFLLCTEKDLVKLARLPWETLPFDRRNQQLMAIIQELIIDGEQEFLQKIFQCVDIKLGLS